MRARGDNHFRLITGSIHRTTAADVAHSARQDLLALFGTSGRPSAPSLGTSKGCKSLSLLRLDLATGVVTGEAVFCVFRGCTLL